MWDGITESNDIADPLDSIIEPLKYIINAQNWNQGPDNTTFPISYQFLPATDTAPEGTLNIFISYDRTNLKSRDSAIDIAHKIGKGLQFSLRQETEHLDWKGYQVVAPIETHISRVTLRINASPDVSLNILRGNILGYTLQESYQIPLPSFVLSYVNPAPVGKWVFSTDNQDQKQGIEQLKLLLLKIGFTQTTSPELFNGPRQFADGGYIGINNGSSSTSSGIKSLSIQASEVSLQAVLEEFTLKNRTNSQNSQTPQLKKSGK